MKSSPKSSEMPPSTGSQTPASGKKLVQARLPFKTLGGSEPPISATIDNLSETAKTTPIADNRKRKQNSTASKEDGIRAAKLNRIDFKNNEVINLETTETMELSNDVPSGNETDNSTKATKSIRKSESKENVCVEIITDDEDDETENDAKVETENEKYEPKAKQSLEFSGKRQDLRKSKRSSDRSKIQIKLPLTKKAKDAAKKGKKHKKSESNDMQTNDGDVQMTEDKEQESDENVDVDASASTAEEEEAESSSANNKTDDDDDDDDDEDEDLDKSMLNDSTVSNVSEKCSTPSNHKLTPKQVQRRLESEKKKQEKEQAKLDRERKLQEEKEQKQREKEERELQKKREREEKDEQRKKEKELREKKLQEEKLEKQREKEQKEQQRKMEREEKEEQRKREKEERELQKKKEREEKEREREDERKKREDEKRQRIEAEQNKNRKTAEAFCKFFKKVENKTDSNEQSDSMDVDQVQQTFVSFQVKENMKIAPVNRRTLNHDERSSLECLISSDAPPTDLYLTQLKKNTIVPRKSYCTWLDEDDDKSSNADDLFIMEEDGENVQVLKEEPKKLYRAKFFKFDENRRPPYYGTWRKKSQTVHARKPLAIDSQMDYEVDSDDEWEEEEPGESLHGSDDEKEVESEDEYEIDNEFFVPHGHLSDEELQNEDETEFNDPADLKIKLKLAQNEFDDERKKKTQKLKPRLIGLIWQKSDGSKPDNCSNGVWELMNKCAMLFNGPSVKIDRPTNQTADNSDDENLNANKPLGVRRLQIGEKEIPDLIRLINGNQKNSKFLVKEFCAYLIKNNQLQREYSSASIKAKIREIATWQACPEEGPMFKKQCWYVPIDTRKRYNLNDLTFPNTWSYTIPLRQPVEVGAIEDNNKMAESKECEKKIELQEFIQLSDDSNSCNLSETLTPELIKQASSKRTNYNIAKFIRPLTQDEKKKQFEPITIRRPSTEQPNETPSTSQTIENNEKTPRNVKPKKRVNLLMSGPVGQELSPKMKSTLVTHFLTNNVRKRKSTSEPNNELNDISSTSTAGTSGGAKKTKLIESVIIIED